MRKTLILLGFLAAFLTPHFALAQAVISTPFTTSLTGVAARVNLNGGQGSCSVVVASLSGSATIVPQVSSDNINYVTATGINAGSITATGTYTGSVTTQGTQSFQINVTGIAGTVAGTVSCTTASIPNSATLTVPTPLPVLCTAANCPVNVAQVGGATVGAATAAGVSATGNITPVQGVTGGVAVPVAIPSTAAGVTVAQVTAANLNATVTPINGTTIGWASQFFYPANTSGGGCDGVTGANSTTGTRITKTNVFSNSLPGTLTQIIAAVASQEIHICGIWISIQNTTIGTLTFQYGTGVNCGTGTTFLFGYIPVSASTESNSWGDGHNGLLDVPTNTALCWLDSGVEVREIVVLTYAQY